MAKGNGKRKSDKGRRQDARRELIRSILILAVIVFILGAWYNTNPKTFNARMADIGFTSGVRQ